jgi:hypothetical protein
LRPFRRRSSKFWQGGSASPEDDVWLIAKGADIGRQSRIYFGSALKTTRSTLQHGFMPI